MVHVSSVTGLRAFPGVLAYNMSKAALDQLTRFSCCCILIFNTNYSELMSAYTEFIEENNLDQLTKGSPEYKEKAKVLKDLQTLWLKKINFH